MVTLADTMILWNSSEKHPLALEIHRRRHRIENPVRIKAVPHLNYRGNAPFDYLGSSVGACFGGWQTCKDTARAAYLMGLFNRIVTEDGLSADEVHKAFLEIDEYAEFHDPKAGEGAKRLNPFWKLHWEWSTSAPAERPIRSHGDDFKRAA